MTKLTLTDRTEESKATTALRSNKLSAKNDGTLDSAVTSAAYYANKTKLSYFVYHGNSYGHAVWRASYKRSDYLNPINNTGSYLYEVTPDLTVYRYEIVRSSHNKD